MSIPPIHNKSRSPLIGLVLVILLYAMASMAQASVLGFVEAESTDNSVQDMVMRNGDPVNEEIKACFLAAVKGQKFPCMRDRDIRAVPPILLA